MAHSGTVDFETYSEAGYVFDPLAQRWTSPPGFPNTRRGLEVVGTPNYTAHESFRPLCLGYDLHDGLGPDVAPFPSSTAIYPCPPRLRTHVEAGGIMEAWNVAFEHYVWEWCVKHWGWPVWPLEQQRCAMARSRAAAYPGGLDNAAAVLGTVRKDPRGTALIRKLTAPRQPTKHNPALRWTPETAPEGFQALYDYCRQDIVAEDAVAERLPELSPFELEVWFMDQRINRRGMCIDLASVDAGIAILEQAAERDNATLRTITGGAVEAYTEVAAMQRWLASRGLHLYELDAETVDTTLERVDLDPDIRRVLRIRQRLALGSVKKLYAMRAQTSADGRLREQYTYHGAHTSLWNGRGVQVANLPRPMDSRFEKPEEVERALAVIACRSIELLEYEYPGLDALEVLASCLRSMIVAAPGHRFISADFTAIQAVVTAALAGEEWRLDVFREGADVYLAQASRMTGTPVAEYVEHKRRTGKNHEHRQNPGKLAVLSGDFGAWINGWKRFGADKLLGSDDNIKQAILRTRATIPAIVELWGGQTRDRFDRWNERAELYGLEGAVVAALQNPGQAYEYRGIAYQMHGADLLCQTPDGGVMYYHNARLKPSDRPYARAWEFEIEYEGWDSMSGWCTSSLYGGVLCQNAVSRTARQPQALALLRLEAAGYPVVMHTHDEWVAEVPIGAGSAEEATALGRERPAWAATPDGRPWPIRVPDAWEGPRYGKF